MITVANSLHYSCGRDRQTDMFLTTFCCECSFKMPGVHQRNPGSSSNCRRLHTILGISTWLVFFFFLSFWQQHWGLFTVTGFSSSSKTKLFILFWSITLVCLWSQPNTRRLNKIVASCKMEWWLYTRSKTMTYSYVTGCFLSCTAIVHSTDDTLEWDDV